MYLTVLTPTLNCGKTLTESLRSVEMLQARFPGSIQHLIGDGGSTDETVEILAQYTHANYWAKAQTLIGLNIPATLNVLLSEARGQWIVVLNGDDYFDVAGMFGVLKQVELSKHPAILCGYVGVLSVDGDILGLRGCRLDKLGRFMSVNHPGMLVDKRVFDLIGIYDINVPTAYDYIWTWRACRASISFEVVSVVLAHARLGGISQSRSIRAAKEILRAKLARGCYLPAWRDYTIFHAKNFLRALLPVDASKFLTVHFRNVIGSIDRY